MIRLEKLRLKQGDFTLDEVSFEIPDGSYGLLVGKSGCGKTTVLEAICGLREASGGKIYLADEEVISLKPGERGVGYVPQDGALFPTLSTREQLAFALRLRKVEPPSIAKRVEELANRLGIEQLLDRMPDGLSGGERQRVALGRALSIRPKFLCLDEPLSALDDETHDEICQLLIDTVKGTGVTVLHVTHNKSETERLADVVFRFEDGKVCSVD
ncbi:MAG: ABC transporter ATP-binding protein [Opitutales bacterium]